MAVKDVKIYTGAAEGWVSIGDLSTLPISSTDGTVKLDSPSANTFTVSTGGVERVEVGATGLKVKSQNQQNETVVLSGNSVSVFDCDPENKVANTAFGVKTDGSYKLYMGSTGNVVIGDNNTNASQKLTVDGDVSGESFVQFGASTCGIFFPTATSIEIHPSSSRTCFYADTLKTEVSGPSASDASIELGEDITLDNKSGSIWLGSSTNAPAGTTNLLVGSSAGAGKNLLISSGQPKTAVEAGSSLSFATVEGNGDRARKTRMYVSPEGNVGIDDVGPDERLCVSGSIKAKRLKGYDVNPQIVLESQQAFLNASDGSDYTPTQPNSIATKSYVDASAGSASLVPFGTPTGDTTPDSPNGSTLHDNLNLYVKGSTNWRKAALYPLDATGGGSDFPLPQPGENAGIEWTSAKVTTGTGGTNQETAVAVAGNAFWMWDQWSINGKDWYGTRWATPGLSVTSPNRGLTVSYGQNVFCGHEGYSYDGQSWTKYTLKNGMRTSNNSFFYQGKHFGGAGQRYFDGEGWVATGMSGSLLNSDSYPGYTIACENSCASLNISDSNGTRFVHVYTAGDMADGTNRWTSAIVSAGPNNGTPLTGITGLARDPENDICVAISLNKAYVQSSPGNPYFREYDLPVAAGWVGLAYDGTHFIAVAEAENANISIRSEDGITWTQSTSLDNPGVTSIAAFNGRAITASGQPSSHGYGRFVSILVSGNQTASTQTTATLPLGTPVDTQSASSVDTGPMARLETQADANGYFDEEIKKKTAVVTLTQIEYDAIPADEIDDRTLYLIT